MLEDTLPPPLFTTFDEDAPRARKSDPATSHAAADGTREKRRTSKQAVLETLRRDGPLADHELVLAVQADATWNAQRMFSPQRIRSARAELVEEGLVEPHIVGLAWEHRKTAANYDADVWRAVADEEAPF